jgi:hypothetical protein
MYSNGEGFSYVLPSMYSNGEGFVLPSMYSNGEGVS